MVESPNAATGLIRLTKHWVKIKNRHRPAMDRVMEALR
jgi:hypothetical protein